MTSLHPPSFHRNDFSTCILNKWENLIYKTMVDVEMSHHEKEWEQEDAMQYTLRQNVILNPFLIHLFGTNPMPSFCGAVEKPCLMNGKVHSQPERSIGC